MDKIRRDWIWLCSIAFLLVASVCWFIYQAISPSDWVRVTVGPFPADTDRWCLVVEDMEGVQSLKWYTAMVTAFAEDPSMIGGFRLPDNSKSATDDIQWREAQRYGVLIRSQDKEWRLVWARSEHVIKPSILRYVFGGGTAEIPLHADDEVETPSKEVLKRIAF
jgi:hypothetical protein